MSHEGHHSTFVLIVTLFFDNFNHFVDVNKMAPLVSNLVILAPFLIPIIGKIHMLV
jgi:hypothetical protein